MAGTDLRASAGTKTLSGNLTRAPADALDPSAIAIVGLICSRRELRTKLRLTTPTGIPLLAESTKMIAAYLITERGLGRIALNTDVDALASILVGGAHLLAAGSNPDRLEPSDLHGIVSATVGSAVQDQSALREI